MSGAGGSGAGRIGAGAALREVATLGGFFAPVLDPAGPGWEPFPGDVAARVGRLAARYPVGTDLRACASTDMLALAARVVSPALAAAVRCGVVPVLTSAGLSVRGDGTLGVATAVTERPADDFVSAVIDTAMADLVAAYAAIRVSEQVLWGNVASALAGAATVLGADANAVAVVTTATASGSLVGAGYYEAPGRFRRRSCCLYYRLPGGGLCGDCVLAGG